jgi:hypothetical protein
LLSVVFDKLGDGRYRASMPDDGSIIHVCPVGAERAESIPSRDATAGPRNDLVRRADRDTDDVVTEAWERVTDEPEIRCVDAGRLDREDGWQVGVAVMEFVRDGDPPYDELVRAIEAAVRSVAGVTGVQREDTEVWWVTGSPSGEQLTQAVADAIDQHADALREHYHRLG